MEVKSQDTRMGQSAAGENEKAGGAGWLVLVAVGRWRRRALSGIKQDLDTIRNPNSRLRRLLRPCVMGAFQIVAGGQSRVARTSGPGGMDVATL